MGEAEEKKDIKQAIRELTYGQEVPQNIQFVLFWIANLAIRFFSAKDIKTK